MDSGFEITAIPLKLIKTNTWLVEKVYRPTDLSNISWIRSVTLRVSFRDNQFLLTFLGCKSLCEPIQGADFMSHIS